MEQTDINKAFEHKLRKVRLRCSINLLAEQAARVLVVLGVVAAVFFLAERLIAVDTINSLSVWGAGICFAAFTTGLWMWKHPSRLQVSLLMDERLKLKERFSTVLALRGSDDVFAKAARFEAYEKAENLDLGNRFGLRLSKSWLWAVSSWLIFGAIFFVPQKDLLGYLHRRREKEEETEKIEQARVSVKEAARRAQAAVKQLGDSSLNEEIASLGQAGQAMNPRETKLEAIRRLGDLSKQVKKKKSEMQLDSEKMLEEMFKQLPGSMDSFSQKLRLALAKGNFQQASQMIGEYQRQLLEGELSKEKQEDISRQLKELGEQLDKLADKNKTLKEELEKLGLDKKLAKLDEKALREALRKQGLSEQQIKQLLQKRACCRSACSNCRGLAGALGACGAGGLSGQELADVMAQLDELEALKQQLLLSQAALDEIDNAVACLGKGMCQGTGCCGGTGKRLALGASSGRGAGHGLGPNTTQQSEEKPAAWKTRVRSKPGRGPAIASWYFKGTQIKGEAQKDFTQVLRAGKDRAAEAITENEIPRKYEQMVKDYFTGLEKSGPD